MHAVRTSPGYLLMIALIAPSTATSTFAVDDFETEFSERLSAGNFAEAAEEYNKRLDDVSDNDRLRAATGVFEVLTAFEGVGRDCYRFGLRRPLIFMSYLPVPIKENPQPEEMTFAKTREATQAFIDRLAAADATLAEVDGRDWKLPIQFDRIAFDIDADGQAETPLFDLLRKTLGKRRVERMNVDGLTIAFDRADVSWTRGYTHVFRATANMLLAYDAEENFGLIASNFFSGAEATFSPFARNDGRRRFEANIMDQIAGVHALSFGVAEPDRFLAAYEHLQTSVKLSRECWDETLRETDDDREWLPGPKQTGVLPLVIGEEQVAGWLLFLDESEAVLNGERLVPHWRIERKYGINLKKVFDNPPPLDLVMWFQGTAAVPYLEEGEVISQETVNRLDQAFGGRFLTFAVFIN